MARKKRRGLRRLGRRIGRGVRKAVGSPVGGLVTGLVGATPIGKIATTGFKTLQQVRSTKPQKPKGSKVPRNEFLQFIAWAEQNATQNVVSTALKMVATPVELWPLGVAKAWQQFQLEKATGLTDNVGKFQGKTSVATTGAFQQTLNPFQMPIVTETMTATVNRAPKGYVIVTNPFTGEKVAMIKEIARKFGFWKPSKKPFLTAGDMNAIRKADRLKKKAQRIDKQLGLTCKPSTRRR